MGRGAVMAEAVSTVYRSTIGYQPTCAGTDASGELAWTLKQKAPWHQKMFPVRYNGDFAVEWMWKSMYEKGMAWDERITA